MITHEEMIVMAREAGIPWFDEPNRLTEVQSIVTLCESAYSAGVAKEREACAKVCDVSARGWGMNPSNDPQSGFIAASNCAYAIRKRGQQ